MIRRLFAAPAFRALPFPAAAQDDPTRAIVRKGV